MTPDDQTQLAARLRKTPLDDCLALSLAYKADRDAADEYKRAVDTHILGQLTQVGLTTGQAYIRPDGASATIQVKTTSTLNRTKLIAAGVPVETIVACTDTKPSAPFLVIRGAKEAEA